MSPEEFGLDPDPTPAAIVEGAWRYKGPDSYFGVPYISREIPRKEHHVEFSERAVANFQNTWFYLALVVGISLAIGVLAALLTIDWSNFKYEIRDAAYLGLAIGGMSLGFGLFFAGMFWLISRFCECKPLDFIASGNELLVRRRGCAAWAPLELFSPSFSVGEISFRRMARGNPAGYPVSRRHLPTDLRGKTHAIWLALAWPSSVRWVLLSVHDSELQAIESIDEWRARFSLPEAGVNWVNKPTPKNVVLMRRQILLWGESG